MIGKVKIEAKHAKAIDYLKDIFGSKFKDDDTQSNLISRKVKGRWSSLGTNVLNDLPLVTFVDALRIGYEVEETFEVGDWVLITEECGHKNRAYKIHHFTEGLANLVYEDGSKSYWPLSYFRHATPEEIKGEQERRAWKSIGREVGEFRDGDVGIDSIGFVRRKVMSINEIYKVGDLDGFYPAESFIGFGSADE